MGRRQQFDSLWKEAITHFFQPFLEYFFDDIAPQVDWSVPVEFLETELRQALAGSKVGVKIADVLAKVHCLDGSHRWVLIHVEVQSQKTESFEERLWLTHGRIRQHYNRPVCSLVILGDGVADWKPQLFSEEQWGCRTTFEFRAVKLLEYSYLLEGHRRSDNPFELLVAAHLVAQKASQNSPQRRRYKSQLLRELLSRCDDHQLLSSFVRLLDWLLALSESQTKLLWADLQDLEEEKMPYITSFERLGLKRGRQEGREEGRQETRKPIVEAICRQWTARWGNPAVDLPQRLEGLSTEKLTELLVLAATAPSLDVFRAALDS